MWWRVQGNPGGPEVGLGTSEGPVAELGAHSGVKTHLQVPVHNVFLVTVVHSRDDLWGRGGQLLVAPNHLSLPRRPCELMRNPGPGPQAPTGRDPGALHPNSVLAGNAVGPAQTHACTQTSGHLDIRTSNIRAPALLAGTLEPRLKDQPHPNFHIWKYLRMPRTCRQTRSAPHTRAEPPARCFRAAGQSSTDAPTQSLHSSNRHTCASFSHTWTPHTCMSAYIPGHLAVTNPDIHTPYPPGHPYNHMLSCSPTHITLPGPPPALLHTWTSSLLHI